MASDAPAHWHRDDPAIRALLGLHTAFGEKMAAALNRTVDSLKANPRESTDEDDRRHTASIQREYADLVDDMDNGSLSEEGQRRLSDIRAELDAEGGWE